MALHLRPGLTVRERVANALFVVGLIAMLVASSGAFEWLAIVLWFGGGIGLIWASHLIAPLPDNLWKYRATPLVDSSHISPAEQKQRGNNDGSAI